MDLIKDGDNMNEMPKSEQKKYYKTFHITMYNHQTDESYIIGDAILNEQVLDKALSDPDYSVEFIKMEE